MDKISIQDIKAYINALYKSEFIYRFEEDNSYFITLYLSNGISLQYDKIKNILWFNSNGNLRIKTTEFEKFLITHTRSEKIKKLL